MNVRSGDRPNPRLYVVTPAMGDPAALAAALDEILGAADVAAILLRLQEADERTLINRVKSAAPRLQAAGAAVILDGRPGIAARSGADGAHLADPEALLEALPSLKPDFIAGAGGLHSRHDAMIAAEAGADYVMFGEPDAAGQLPSRDAVIDRITWWAEVFEVPCVGFAPGLDAIGALVAAGADFIAVGDVLFDDPRGPGAVAAEAAALLTLAETAT